MPDMLITLTLATLFTLGAIAALLSLIDSWISARVSYRVLRNEQRLLAMGYMPEVEAKELRLRRSARAMRSSGTVRVRTGAVMARRRVVEVAGVFA